MAHLIKLHSLNQSCQMSNLITFGSLKFSWMISLSTFLQDRGLFQSFLLDVLFQDDLCHGLSALKLYLCLRVELHCVSTLYECRGLDMINSFFSIHHKRKFCPHYHSYFFCDFSASFFHRQPSHCLCPRHLRSHLRNTQHRMNLDPEVTVKL